MRFLRSVALFGSLILLVATTASLVNRRAELLRDRDTDAVSAAAAAEISIHATVARARTLTAGVNAFTDPAELARSFSAPIAACVGPATALRCSGDDVTVLPPAVAAVELSERRDGRPVAMIDGDSGTAIVARGGDIPVVLQLGPDVLVGNIARTEIARLGATVAVEAVDGNVAPGRTVDSFDGRRIVRSPVGEAFDNGAVMIRTGVPSGVGWGADAPGVYGTLLAIGAVLLAAAGWTFLVERRQLEQQAATDELTGLVNRREFERESEAAIEMAGRVGAGLCIMLIDLNGFKQINDTLGHQVGDLVLRTCADRLREAVRDTDLVGRWGGDEFVVLLPGLEDSSAVRDSAERIARSLSSAPAARDVTITGSIGAALFPRHGERFEDLMHAADEAMYEAKTSGVTHRLAEAIPTRTLPAPSAYLGPERRRTAAHADDRAEQPDHAPTP